MINILIINELYIVLKKLGFGYFSTVWFCHDLKENKFVAVKVQKSGKNHYSAAEDEIEILDVIQKQLDKRRSKGINNVFWMGLLNNFEFKGPNGVHLCMVFEIMGKNLYKIMQEYGFNGIPMPIVRVLAKQILIGVDHLHRFCKVIHTDLKPENVICSPTKQQLMGIYESIPKHFRAHIKDKIDLKMFYCKEQMTSENLILKDLNNRDKWKDKNLDKSKDEWYQKYTDKIEELEKQKFNENSNEILTENSQVKIWDFGNGCWTYNHFTSSIQTRQYRSPEVILGIEYDESWDLWSYAWMIFELQYFYYCLVYIFINIIFTIIMN